MSKVYEIITETIIKKLQEGVVPWHKPWVGGPEGMPKNIQSNRHYSGVNIFLLHMQGYASPLWMTFNQCKKLKGSIRKDEHYTPIIYFKMLESKEDPTKKFPMLRFYKVWNLEQVEGLDQYKEEPEPQIETFKPIEKCEKVVKGFKGKPTIGFNGGSAYYKPSTDEVMMPKKDLFKDEESYYATLFHELVHSTGHQKRLNREGISILHDKGKHAYSKEELVAEMGASFLCGLTGIEQKVIDNSASYIASWIARLQSPDNQKLVIEAGSKSRVAVEHILGESHDE